MDRDEIRRTLRTFILTNFLPGEAPESLEDSTLLVSSGLITSMSMVELVDYIEDRFSLTLESSDLRVGKMDSIDLLVDLVLGRAANPDSSGTSG